MTLDKDQINSKIRSLCTVLMNDGVSNRDYLEQITYLIFLKMAYERTQAPFNQTSDIPQWYTWDILVAKDGEDLEKQYRNTLETLAKEWGMLWLIFRKSQNKISNPAMLKRIINEIDKIQRNVLGVDVKWEIYEWLLSKVAEDTKSWAWQYFTPRSLISAIVQVMNPTIDITVNDPCCGTGWFLLEAHEHILHQWWLDTDQLKVLKNNLISWQELVQDTARLAVMNMYLHGIGSKESPIAVGDSLAKDPGQRYDIILTNPPFGKTSSHTFTTTTGEEETEDFQINRDDFWTTTPNKQLNFIQHIHTILSTRGRAAVVLPDNVLFEWWKGEIVRKKLLDQTNLHTILRLPTWIFYAKGVKANVLFFDKKPASEQIQTKKVWIYDMRTNKKFSLKQSPLRVSDLEEFIACFNSDNINQRTETRSEQNPEWRRRVFDYEDIIKRDKTNLDIFWLKDNSLIESENLPEPWIIASQIMEELENALEQFSLIEKDLNK